MTNIASILEGRLGPSRVELLRSAARAASELGVPLYLVGGSVRDALLGGLKHRCDTPHPSPLPQGERGPDAGDLDVSYTSSFPRRREPRGGGTKIPLTPTLSRKGRGGAHGAGT